MFEALQLINWGRFDDGRFFKNYVIVITLSRNTTIEVLSHLNFNTINYDMA